MIRVPNTPRSFFDGMVLPAYRDWQEDPQAEHRAKSVVHNLNVMAEQTFAHFGANSAEVYGMPKVHLFRKEQATRECPDFQLVWDIDDAHKHVSLDVRIR